MKIFAATAALATTLTAVSSHAALIRYEFTATVTELISDVGDAQVNLATMAQYGVVPGAAIVGVFVIDTTTHDIRPDDPGLGLYQNPGVETSILVGDLLAAIPGSVFGSDSVIIVNRDFDRWTYSSRIVPDAPGFSTATLQVSLLDESGTALTDDLLGLVPPLDIFDAYSPLTTGSTGFLATYEIPSGVITARGELHSFARVVPLPAPILLLASAMLSLGAVRRRRPSPAVA